jgi:uncharacterized protein (TIRG00374 family)
VKVARLAALASLAAGLIVIVVVVRRAGAALNATDLLLSPRAHLLALLAFAVDMACRGLRVVLIARGLDERLTLATSIGAQFAGDAAGSVTPSRVGSDPAKLAILGRDGIRLGAGGALMVGEILAEIVVLTLVAVAAAFVLPTANKVALGALSYSAVVASTTAAAILLVRTPAAEPPGLLRRLGISALRWQHFRNVAQQFAAKSRALLQLRASTVIAVLFVTAIHMAGRLAILPILAATDRTVIEIGPLIAWPLVLLYAGALVPAPAGGGAVELGFATALGATLPASVLAGALVWWRVYTFYLSTLCGGLVIMFAGRLLRPHPSPT